MKRYFFDLSDGGRELDELGTELRDDAAAQREAVRFAGEVLRNEPHRLEHGELRVDVHDHDTRFAIVVNLERNRSDRR